MEQVPIPEPTPTETNTNTHCTTTTNSNESKINSNNDSNTDTAAALLPTCSLCLNWYCEPIETSCKHTFCRVCLLQSTQLSPDGRKCPLCRTPLIMPDPKTHPIDRTLETLIRQNILSSEYELRLSSSRQIMADLAERARTTVPIFYMSPGVRTNRHIALHLFEPRYRILIRRAMENYKMFVYCGALPKKGNRAVLVQIHSASFFTGGRADVVGIGVEEFQLDDVWVEDGTAGLYYTRFVSKPGGFRPQLNGTNDEQGGRRRVRVATPNVHNSNSEDGSKSSRYCVVS